MKNFAVVAIVIALALGVYFIYSNNVTNIQQQAAKVQAELEAEFAAQSAVETNDRVLENGPSITPISHASVVLAWAGKTIYVDPVGDVSLYTDMMAPDLVLVTDTHGDHLSIETLDGVIAGDSLLVVTQAVYEQLPESLAAQAMVMSNGQTSEVLGFTITAVPMYNVPESADAYHVKGQGNGYVVEFGGTRIYIAGDTGNTPEMRALTNIDTAFVPMNLPFTMTVEEAAEAVLAFAPKTVIPYHYRNRDGFSDVARFKQIVESRNAQINVLLLNWYGESETSDEALEIES